MSPTSSTPLRILTLAILPPKTKLHYPGRTSQKHNSSSNPRNDQVFSPAISEESEIIAVFVKNVREFVLQDGDDDGGDEECEEGDRSKAPVAEGDEARAVQEERYEGGEDGEACCGDADCVEHKGR